MIFSGKFVAKFVEPCKDEQIQPNGVDLTVKEVYVFKSKVEFSGKIEALPVEEITPDDKDFWDLNPGAYMVRYGEVIRVPRGAIGLVLPRSSLLRVGCTLFTAVWDSGYEGRGIGLLVVFNPNGIKLKRGSRIGQLIFIKAEEQDIYKGQWQREGL
ncbi:MAG: deoxyuridine 5'-triphosphate nucleotidohydrolase [Crenarchaeota archaeon]|nr:deoxyuridine 5'-triphosphate nucleotidohydrolase [Thermoproteota archaeon]